MLTVHPPSLPMPLALALTRALWKFNKLIGRNDEVTPDAMYMFARPGGYSIAKARRMLGFAPKVSLADGLQRSHAWLCEIGELKP